MWALLCSGCAMKVIGMVEPAEPRTRLVTTTGQAWQLVLSDDAAPIRFLDGHLTEVQGARWGKRIRVRDWRVIEGVNGLPVWVGTLQVRNNALGVMDRNSGVFTLVHPDAQPVLAPYIGVVVLVEGWVEGAQVVRVVYFRVLAEEGT